MAISWAGGSPVHRDKTTPASHQRVGAIDDVELVSHQSFSRQVEIAGFVATVQ